MEDETDGLLNVVRRPPRKKHCCLQTCMTSNGRPSALPLHAIIILKLILVFCFTYSGYFYIPDYFNGNGTDAVVIGYTTRPEICIWITYPVFTYTIQGTTYIVENYYDFGVCGDYKSTSLAKAQATYPLNSTIPIWYTISDPSKLMKDPRPYVKLLIIQLAAIGFGIGWFIGHLFMVCCCGFETCCFSKRVTCRCHDPFRDLS